MGSSQSTSAGTSSQIDVIALVSFFMVLVTIGATVFLFFYFNKRIQQNEDDVKVTQEEEDQSIKAITAIRSNYVTNQTLATNNDTIRTQMQAFQKDYTTKYNALNSNIQEVDYNVTNFANELVNVFDHIGDGMEYIGSNIDSMNHNINVVQSNLIGMRDNIQTNKLNIHDFSITGDPATNNLFVSSSRSNAIVMMNNAGFSNVTVQKSMNIGNYIFQTDPSNNLSITNPSNSTAKIMMNNLSFSNASGQTLTMNGGLNFASVGTAYTLDVGSNNNLRLKMASGSNAEFGMYNQNYAKMHAFDSYGNAAHQGNIYLNNKSCIELGAGIPKPTDGGTMCYQKKSTGLDITGSGPTQTSPKTVNIWDNLVVNKGITTSNLMIDNLELTVQNGKIIVSNAKGPLGIVTLSNY